MTLFAPPATKRPPGTNSVRQVYCPVTTKMRLPCMTPLGGWRSVQTPTVQWENPPCEVGRPPLKTITPHHPKSSAFEARVVYRRFLQCRYASTPMAAVHSVPCMPWYNNSLLLIPLPSCVPFISWNNNCLFRSMLPCSF